MEQPSDAIIEHLQSQPAIGCCKVSPLTVTFAMGKIRRGGYLFVTWIGDHRPRHVHVFRDGQLVVKWNLERGVPMTGRANARIRALITALQREGAL